MLWNAFLDQGARGPQPWEEVSNLCGSHEISPTKASRAALNAMPSGDVTCRAWLYSLRASWAHGMEPTQGILGLGIAAHSLSKDEAK